MNKLATIIALLPLVASAAISDLLTQLEDTRIAITNAIVLKGGTASGALTNVPSEIASLPSGGGFTNDYVYVRGFSAAISASSLLTNSHASIVGIATGEVATVEGAEKIPVTVDWIFLDSTYADDVEFFVRAGDMTNGWADAQITNYTILAAKTIDGTVYENVYEGTTYLDAVFANKPFVAFTDVSAQGETDTFGIENAVTINGSTGLTGNFAATNAGAKAVLNVSGGAITGVNSNVFDFASSPRSTVAITINAADWAYVPTGSDLTEMLRDAYIMLYYRSLSVKIPVTSLAANTRIAAVVSLDCTTVAYAQLFLGHGSTYYEIVRTKAYGRLTEGGTTDFEFNLNAPDRSVRQIGRAQITSYAAANSGAPQDFLVVRDYKDGSWITRAFHWDAEGTLCDDTGFVNGFKLYTNDTFIGWSTTEPTNTFMANFPWNGLELVDVRVDGWTVGATNLFKFSKIPLYYVKFSQENIDIANYATLSTNSTPCNIWWLSSSEGDGFVVADWEKIYRDGETPLVKSANYYARYKSSKTGVQSYPWPNTTLGFSRQSLDEASKVLNNYPCIVYQGGTNYTLAADTTNRRWSGNTWLDYQAFAFLSYIQFGADTQATIWGNVSSNPESGGVTSQAQQSCAEGIFSQGETDFVIGTHPRASCNFAWLGILNFWGSEGDQMCDVQGWACRENGTNFYAFAYQPDHALLRPAETDWSACLTTDKYIQMPYRAYWYGSYTQSGYWRGSAATFGTAAGAYWLANAEGAEHSLGAMNLRSVDNCWLPGYPSTDGTHNAYMVSLSSRRGNGSYIGPWCVNADSGVGDSRAGFWGSRPSFVCPK